MVPITSADPCLLLSAAATGFPVSYAETLRISGLIQSCDLAANSTDSIHFAVLEVTRLHLTLGSIHEESKHLSAIIYWDRLGKLVYRVKPLGSATVEQGLVSPNRLVGLSEDFAFSRSVPNPIDSRR
jgi:hypothetical protein